MKCANISNPSDEQKSSTKFFREPPTLHSKRNSAHEAEYYSFWVVFLDHKFPFIFNEFLFLFYFQFVKFGAFLSFRIQAAQMFYCTFQMSFKFNLIDE